MRRVSNRRSATPPTTPPAIAPVLAFPLRPPLCSASVVGSVVEEEVGLVDGDVTVDVWDISVEEAVPFTVCVRTVVRVL